MREEHRDVVIVGAGVIGYSIAFRLKRMRPETRIAVLGDAANSLAASRAAAGMLAPFGECDTADRFFAFCRQSLDKYPVFVKELQEISGRPVYFSMAGSIMPATSYAERWDERLKFFRSENVPHEIWSGKTVAEKLPWFAKNIREVIWVGEGQVNNRQLHEALAAACLRLGVEMLPGNATGFLRDASAISAVMTDAGEVRGSRFVIAAGSWSPQMGLVLGLSVPMKPIKGQMCRLMVEDHRLEYTVHGILTYIAPWRGGQGFVLGSTMEDRGFDPAIEESAIRGLVERASEIMPCLREAPLVETWTGLRPAPDDLMPIMGKSSRYRNLYFSTGHYRNGILQTPNQADYLAAVLLDSLKDEIPEFSPARYDI